MSKSFKKIKKEKKKKKRESVNKTYKDTADLSVTLRSDQLPMW